MPYRVQVLHEQTRDARRLAAELTRAVEAAGHIPVDQWRTMERSVRLGIDDRTLDADVFVILVVKGTRSIWYETGFLHGAGRPTLLVLASRSVRLPIDLVGVNFLSLDPARISSNEFLFRLSKNIDKVREDKRFFGEPRRSSLDWWQTVEERSPRTKQRQLPPQTLESAEEQLLTLARAVPGWSIVEKEGRDGGYDFVIWNESPEPRLGALGNPIVVAAKSSHVGSDSVDSVVRAAAKSGVKGIIVVSPGLSTSASRNAVRRAYRSTGIAAIVLDQDKLRRIRTPADLVGEIIDVLVSLTTRED